MHRWPVRVDPEARTVRVEGGCRWGDVDHATHPFGLATVSGINSDTGIGTLIQLSQAKRNMAIRLSD